MALGVSTKVNEQYFPQAAYSLTSTKCRQGSLETVPNDVVQALIGTLSLIFFAHLKLKLQTLKHNYYIAPLFLHFRVGCSNCIKFTFLYQL